MNGLILDCKMEESGLSYIGTINTTKSSKTCQSWNSQYPHGHIFNNSSFFPDETIEEASNFCRNPDNSIGGPWCLTLDRNTRMELCDVPICCKLNASSFCMK